jgi:2'-5' RNA ligase
VRAFLAVALDAGVREAVASLSVQLRRRPGGGDVRWVHQESLHVTLHFLGDVEMQDVAAVLEHVAAEVAPLAPFRLHTTQASVFPSRRRPRVVALGLEPEAPLCALAEAVGRGVAAAGLPAEERPYRPHLTLGRFGRGNRPATSLDVTAPDTPVSDAWVVSEVTLFRSDLQPAGAQYTPLGHARLEGTPGGGPDHP